MLVSFHQFLLYVPQILAKLWARWPEREPISTFSSQDLGHCLRQRKTSSFPPRGLMFKSELLRNFVFTAQFVKSV